MQNNNVNITQYSQPFEELCSGLTTSKYEHLRLILSKNNDLTLGQKYLMVSRNNFGLVKLHNVDFVNDKIVLDMEEVSNGLRKDVLLDINDTTFKFLLVSWQDIKQIVKSEIVSKTDSADLLYFEF